MPDDTVTCIHCNGRIRTCDNAGTEATPYVSIASVH